MSDDELQYLRDEIADLQGQLDALKRHLGVRVESAHRQKWKRELVRCETEPTPIAIWL